ncbi:HalOD1 output domain-containing protein [Natrialbaceae archaeon A-arb3/5]
MTRSREVDTAGVCERIVTEVAELDNTKPTRLPPLFGAVDPDSLSSVFAPTESAGDRVGRIEFPYAGYDITVEFEPDPILTIE